MMTLLVAIVAVLAVRIAYRRGRMAAYMAERKREHGFVARFADGPLAGQSKVLTGRVPSVEVPVMTEGRCVFDAAPEPVTMCLLRYRMVYAVYEPEP